MTITIVGGGNPSGPTFPVQRSVRLRSSATAYFNRTPAVAGNQRTWTWSGWVKIGNGTDTQVFGAATSTSYVDMLSFGSSGIGYYSFFSAAYQIYVQSTAVFRDPSAWYHVVLAVDTTQATAANRVRIYVNGVQQALTTTYGGYGTQNLQVIVNSTVQHNIGRYPTYTAYFDGYLTEVNFVNGYPTVGGTTYDATSWAALNVATLFGSYNTYGVWSASKYSGTYSTNGFYLNFQDNSAATAAAIGKDSSGNGNNWTPNNINLSAYTGTPPINNSYDSMLDVPTLTSNTNSNFCTYTPLATVPTGGGTALATLSGANLDASSAAANFYDCFSTFNLPTSGQWYFEWTVTTIGTNHYLGIGSRLSWTSASRIYVNSGQKSTNGTLTAYGASYTSGDVIGCAIDMGAGTLVMYKNNVSQGTLASDLISALPAEGWAIVAEMRGTAAHSVNFGQRPFSYTPPTGFQRLNTYNLPTPTIPNGAAQMNIVPSSVTGRSTTGGGTAKSITSLAFQPDLVMSKDRSQVTRWGFIDSVRGVNKTLASNLTDAEVTSQTDLLTAFTSNGFNVGTDAAGYGWNYNVGASTQDVYCYWAWKANGTPAVTNTSGSIPSTISANTTSGFSIVTYTGTGANATVGHGLGIAPKMVIVKGRSTVADWKVYHANLTSAAYTLFLSTTNAQTADLSWNNTAPTSSVINIGPTGYGVNNASATYVAYCFSEIAGYSKFGSYTGNGSTDGPFVYLGFRPRFILRKRTDTTSDWLLQDSSRPGYNATTTYTSVLYPDTSGVETIYNEVDILSNGFKIRASDAFGNASGGTYIYAAFAENPFNYSLAR